jgi:hypothetical protein
MSDKKVTEVQILQVNPPPEKEVNVDVAEDI